jgi:predicted methyltransferase
MKRNPIPDFIIKALADKSRPKRDFARDQRDKAAEVLAFAGIQPGDTVVDFLPYRGYYTRMFASLVGDSGHVYAAIPDAFMNYERIATTRVEVDALAESRTTVTIIGGQPEHAGEPPHGVDVFWISQNYHDLHDVFLGPVDVAAFNRSVFAALRPGGTYVIIDHTAQAGAPVDVTETLHRIEPAVVRREVEAAGFVYESQSNALANARDALTGGIFGRRVRYHTDRFILKFHKPD